MNKKKNSFVIISQEINRGGVTLFFNYHTSGTNVKDFFFLSQFCCSERFLNLYFLHVVSYTINMQALAAHDLQQFLITKLVYSRLEEIKQSGIVKELFCDLMQVFTKLLPFEAIVLFRSQTVHGYIFAHIINFFISQLSCLFQLLLSIYHAVAPFTENPIATLSLVLAEENFKELCAIIPPDFDRSEVAILSGLEVNTHHDADDFFIPLNFTIRHKDGSYENVLPNLLDILQK